jgi:hypothetical protein
VSTTIAKCLGVLCAVVLVLAVGELRLSNDSYDYLQAAADVSQNGGIPISYSWWPPLMPLTLAPFTDMPRAALWLNAAAYGLIVALVLGTVTAHMKTLGMVLIAGALLVFPALRFVHEWIWSEPLFVALVAAWFALLLAGVQDGRRVVLLGLVAALLGLQRYVGVLFVPIGGLALLLYRVQWKRIVLYAVIAGVPLGVWMLRNIALGYPATGLDRGDAYWTFAKATEIALLTLISWWLPLLIVFLVGWWYRVRVPRKFVVVSVYYVVLHTVFIIWSASSTSMDPPDQRLLAPVVVPLIYVMLAAGGRLAKRERRYAYTQA